jgi:hypothetical protein
MSDDDVGDRETDFAGSLRAAVDDVDRAGDARHARRAHNQIAAGITGDVAEIHPGPRFRVGLRSLPDLIGPAACQIYVLRSSHFGKREEQRQPGHRDVSEIRYHF